MAMFLFFCAVCFFLHWRRRQCADDDDGVNAYYIRQSVSYNFIHTLLLLWSFIASHYYRPPVMERSWWCTTFQFLKRLIEKKMSHWIKKKVVYWSRARVPIENSSNLIYNLHGQNIAGFNTHESELDIN